MQLELLLHKRYSKQNQILIQFCKRVIALFKYLSHKECSPETINTTYLHLGLDNNQKHYVRTCSMRYSRYDTTRNTNKGYRCYPKDNACVNAVYRVGTRWVAS